MREPTVRPARPQDEEAVAELLYLSAAGMYDAYAGGRDRALVLLRRAFRRPGTNASAETVVVAEVDGRVAGALSAFPIAEGTRRARAFLGLTLRSLPPWRWPAAIRLYRLGGRLTPAPPPGALYVDGLATDPLERRRGVARALLAEARARARAERLRTLALDTALDNAPARSLYESEGFAAEATIPPREGLPGFVAYVSRLG